MAGVDLRFADNREKIRKMDSHLFCYFNLSIDLINQSIFSYLPDADERSVNKMISCPTWQSNCTLSVTYPFYFTFRTKLGIFISCFNNHEQRWEYLNF